MGQERLSPTPQQVPLSAVNSMAPMGAMNAKAMTKGGIAEALSTSTEVKSTGVFTIPGVCKIKTRMKPATKAGKREVFGKVVMVKAKPARKVVKAFPVSALKKSV